jgi:hypothetical protein
VVQQRQRPGLTQQNLLNANVTNPFFIGNFEPLSVNPTLYNQMAGTHLQPTIQRSRLLRPFPNASGDRPSAGSANRREQGALD